MTLVVIDPAVPQSQPAASLTARTATAAGELFVAQVEATDPNGDTLTYGLAFPDSAREPGGLVIDPDTGRLSWTPGIDDVTAANGQPYLYTVTVNDGNTPVVSLGPVELTVVSRFTNAVPEFTTEPTGIRSEGNDALVYEANAVDPDGDPVVYSLDSAPAGASIDRTTGRFVWRPDAGVRQDQAFEARITATDPYGASATQVIELRFTAGNAAPRITSTPPQPGFGGETWTYLVTATDADGDAVTFSLDGQTPGDTSGLSITQLSATTARVVWTNPAAAATRSFDVVATDARGLVGRQSISLTIGSQGSTNPTVDLPPVITSTPVFAVVAGEDYRYRVVAEDPDATTANPVVYGLQAGAPSWLSIDAATGVLSGTAPTDADGQTPRVSVTATQAGVTALQGYTLQVTSNALNPDNTPINNAPVIEPRDGLVAFAGAAFGFNVVARDNEGHAITYTLVDNQGDEYTTLDGVSIDANGRVTWEVPAAATPGTTTLGVLARDSEGAVSAVQTFAVEVRASGTDDAPTVGLRANTNRLEAGRPVTFAVDASDDVGIAQLYVEITAPFLSETFRIDVDATGLARYNAPAASAGQDLSVTAFAVDTSGNVSDAGPLVVGVFAPDTAAPVIRLSTPYGGSLVEARTQIQGAIYDEANQLVYASVLLKTPNGQSISLLEQGSFNSKTVITGQGSAGTDVDLGEINPFSLSDGVYVIEVLAQDRDGRIRSLTNSVEVKSRIGDEVKLGNFRQTFVDMQVPVAGLPITVERTYDSLEASTQGDFGYGWSLDILSGQAEVSNLAQDDIISSDDFLGANFDTPWQFGTRLTLDLPGGEQLGFTAVADALGGSGVSGFAGFLVGGGTGISNVAFQPDGDSLGNKLELLGGGAANRPLGDDNAGAFGLTAGQSIGTFEVRQASDGRLTTPTGLPFNPTSLGADYLLTTRDGRKFVFDSRTGALASFTDPYGNRLEFDDNAITAFRSGSSTPTGGITITRDGANDGRITRIENALGFGVNYRYDGFGDLIGVDQDVFLDDPATAGANESEVVTTTFGYQTPEAVAAPNDATLRQHFLDKIIDSEGNSLVKNEYDSDGRLKKVTDGNDADTTVTYDDATNTQTTIDAFGVTTIATYDEQGNVTRLEQPTTQFGGDPVVYTFEYDEDGNLLNQTDPVGRVTSYTYDDRGRLDSTTAPYAPGEDPADFTTTYTYDDRTDQITTITDPNGRQERREYNAFGDLTKLSDETGHVYSEWDFDGAGRVIKEGSPDEGYFLYRYDPVTGTLLETEDPEGNVIGSQYDTLGQLTGFTDEDGQNTLSYDGLGREVRADYGDLQVDYTYGPGAGSDWTKVESQSTGTIERLLSPTGQLEGWNLANGGEVRYGYDRGRLDTETDALGRVTRYAYNDLGRVSRVTDETTGNFVDYTYDKAGRVLSTTDALGRTVVTDPDDTDSGRQVSTNARGFSAVADVNGLITTITEGVTIDPGDGSVVNTPATRTTFVERNAAGLPIRFTNADGSFSTVAYRNSDVLGDAEQSPTRITDEAGRSRVYTYEPDGRLKTASDLGDNQITLNYDDSEAGDGRLDSITGPTGETVTYGYDADDRLTTVTRQGLGTTTVTRFAADGEPEEMVLATGETVTLVYDGSGRVESRITDTGETATFAYDANDQVQSLTDNTGQTLYAYYSAADPQEAGASHIGRLKSITQPNGTSVTYAYDISGQVKTVTTRASTTDPTPRTTSYTYDLNGNIETVTDPFSGVTSYTYDQRDRLETRTLPNGVVTTWSFDSRDRLLSLVHADGGGAVLSSFAYTHPGNATGEPSRITREDGSYVALTYDAANRLSGEAWHDDSGTLTETITYAYDAAGNRTRVTNAQGAFNYAASIESDHLLAAIDVPGGDDAGFTYGPGGVLETITRDGETWTLDYNSGGQIITATNTAGRTLTYTYDGSGQRVGVSDSAAADRNYLVGLPAQNLGVSIGHRYLEADTSGGLVNGWVYAGENPILRYDASGNVGYYLEDASDSIAALTDGAGSLTATHAYDGFGNLRPGSDAVEDFGYHAAVHDPVTGLIDFRLRTYDPQTGRFTSVDPVEPDPGVVESYNPYMFSNNNPHLYSDPTGGFSLSELNVTNLISAKLRSVKGVVLNELKDTARDTVLELATNAILNSLSQFLPVDLAGFVDESSNQSPASQMGTGFENAFERIICPAIQPTGLGGYLWFQPQIEADGTPRSNGHNCGEDNTDTLIQGVPRPDFLFRSGGPFTGRNNGNKAYLVGDIKLDTKTFYNAYVKKSNSKQFRAIVNYTKEHSYGIAAFIALQDTRANVAKSLAKKVEKLGIKSGVHIQLISTLPQTGRRR